MRDEIMTKYGGRFSFVTKVDFMIYDTSNAMCIISKATKDARSLKFIWDTAEFSFQTKKIL